MQNDKAGHITIISFPSFSSPDLPCPSIPSAFPRGGVTAYLSSRLSAERRGLLLKYSYHERDIRVSTSNDNFFFFVLFPFTPFLSPFPLASTLAPHFGEEHAIRSLLNIWWKLACTRHDSYLRQCDTRNWKSMERLALRVYRIGFSDIHAIVCAYRDCIL